MACCPQVAGAGRGGQGGYSIPPVTLFQVRQNATRETSGGEVLGNAMLLHPPLPPPTEQTNPAVWKNCRVGDGLTKRCLWCEERTERHRRIREDFRVSFPPPPSVHHAHLSLLSQNQRITPQSQQASHTLKSIRNNGNRFFYKDAGTSLFQ